MARLFYHKPRFAVLDQCTDAVSVDVEEALYEQARKLGVTIITISQRPGLMVNTFATGIVFAKLCFASFLLSPEQLYHPYTRHVVCPS